MKREYGVVISGGGGGIGVLATPMKIFGNRIKYDTIVANSSGAIVGIMYSIGKIDRLIEILYTIVDSEVVRKRKLRYARKFLTYLIGFGDPLMGTYDNAPLRKLLRSELLGETTEIEFTAIAVDLHNGAIAYWTIPPKTTFTDKNVDMFVSWIISSTAIPGVFSPEEINEHFYVDGGVKTQAPIEPLQLLMPQVDHITIISSAGPKKPEEIRVRSDIDVFSLIVPMMVENVVELDIVKFTHRNELAQCGSKKWKYYPYIMTRPTQPTSPTVRFHHKYTIPDMEQGRKLAEIELIKYERENVSN